MPNWSAAGRIYQNPLKKNEIHFNLGPGDEGHIYPAYEPWMEAQGVSEANYERLVREVKRHFAEREENNYACLASVCLCCCTAGVLSCPLCFLVQKEEIYDEELRKLVERISNSKMTMGEDRVFEDPPAIPWLDSKGNPCVFDSPTGFPWGYSLRARMPACLRACVLVCLRDGAWDSKGTQQENAVPWGYSLLLQASPMPWPPNAPAVVIESAGPAGNVPGAAPTVIGAPVAPAGVVAATPVQQTMAAEDNPNLAENSPNLAAQFCSFLHSCTNVGAQAVGA